MTSTALYVVIALIWVGAGVAAAVFLGRAGHRNRLWYVVGAILGLLFVPIALERTRRGARTRQLTPATRPSGHHAGEEAMTVLVGVDDSAEAVRALADVVQVFGPARPRLVLVSVVDHDTAEGGSPDDLDTARRTRSCWAAADVADRPGTVSWQCSPRRYRR